MVSRRFVLLSSTAFAALSVAGCGGREMAVDPPADLPARSIDAHAHIFNATDIPIPGFVDQVLLRKPEEPLKNGSLTNALIRLVVNILLNTKQTAAKELERLPLAGPVPQTPPEALLAQDKEAVAKGIRQLEAGQQTIAAIAPSPEQQEDAALLRELDRFTGGFFAAPNLTQDRGTAIADAIFDEARPSGVNSILGGPDFDLAQNLKWAALLTRDRRDILGELIRLYGLRPDPKTGAPIGITAFSPSIVDFEYWFKEAPQGAFSPIEDQMAVMSRLARLEDRAVLFNFAPFCPLRAVKERGRNWHGILQRAIKTQGFVGIKMYPPMGFSPWGNDPSATYGQRFKATGAQINAELERLYGWCQDLGVPIKTHGNNSLSADMCSGKNAAPNLWGDVLAAYPDLRVNIAHFGGFEEDLPPVPCADTAPNYETRAAALMSRSNHAYVDLGYWTEVVGRNRPGTDLVRKVNDLLAEYPLLAERIMYGSDYSMIGRERQHGAFLVDVENAIGRLNGDLEDQILSRNAQRYLMLDDPGSPARKRLRRFFPSGHPYYAMVGE